MKPILCLSALLLAAILLAGASYSIDPDMLIPPPHYTNLFLDTNVGQTIFSLSLPRTNHYSNLLSVLSITPLTNRCSICGEQHHEQHVCHYECWDTLTVEIVCQGQTSTPQIWMGPRESRIVTQTVARTHAVVPAQVPLWIYPGATNWAITNLQVTPR